ncbi:amino acid adenylation domain-containing protein/thioester reductase domain-containing protein [Lentzea fradiae]|uniref:Amino acid adenylation domain-containing protein/thioester reductase domain-containing protein n=1 Tax=Lentzea fradiae TaxID=200378 RepID=A0A1G8BHJ8_9PSEU|nr:non-ribosomal peptide synthetase [Lentzea fradiae]SDH32715.1 amino acid adenylation domain-containing protein/thioester reductase domain-containing protein [Lentzea fradiae]
MNSPLESAVLELARTVTGVADLSAADSLSRRCGGPDALPRVCAAVRAVFAAGLTGELVRGADTVGELARAVERLREGAPRRPSLSAGLAQRRGDSVPASSGQSGIWLADQYAPSSTAYNGPFHVLFPEALDPEALREAVRRVVDRHEVLRTNLLLRDGVLTQVVSPEARFRYEVREFSSDDEPAAIASEVARTRVDLGADPVVTVVCATRAGGPRETAVVCNIHHAASDAASAGLFLTELMARYDEVVTGLPTADRGDRPQYADFARWHELRLAGPELPRLLDHWTDRLGGELPALDLPTDRPRPATRRFAGDVLPFTVPAPLVRELHALGAAEGVTLFMIAHAAYALLLSRYARQDEVAVGTPVSLRDPAEAEDVIGYLVNMVVLRHRLDDTATVRDLLRAVRDEAADAMRHKWAPFEKVIERVRPKRGGGYSPLIQTMLVLTPPGSTCFERGGRRLPIHRDVGHGAKYDLSLVLQPGDAGELAASFEYDTDLFDAGTVRGLGERLVHVLAEFARRPDAALGEVRLLSPREERALLARDDRVAERTPPRPTSELFEERVAKAPDAVAVEHEDRSLTYRELNEQANRLAHLLRERGTGVGDRVGLYLRRSVESVVALLGVLKSGAAYVPVDPSYPRDRVEDMLADAGVRLIITDSASASGLPATAQRLELDREDLSGLPADDPGRVKRPEDEVYVVHTSGSTGRPKGVVIRDETVANLVEVQDRVSPVGATGRTLQYMSLSFDVSVMEILGTLCAGGTLVLISEEVRKDLHALAEFLRRHDIARVYLPYVAVQGLAAIAADAGLRLEALREVASVGEQLVVSPQIRRFFAEHPDARLLNMYGPSETHLATWHEVGGDPASWPEAPAIGHGIAGLRLAVLDRRGAVVPPGVPGELHLGGPVLSPGYHRRPEETEQRFLPDPFHPGEVLYRTGDLVRRTRDGLEYLGRVDDQIKIRGYRIEPAEVEAAIDALDLVAASAVTAVDVAPGDRRLVAFVAGGPEDPREVARALTGVLPDHMVPAHVVRLERLPLTPSGKADRKALRGMFSLEDTRSDAPAEPPATPLEESVARQWAELLGGGAVGRHDDFFTLGGHSIMATELVYRLRREHDVDLPLRVMLENPTVAGMAARIAEIRDTGTTAAPRGLDLPAEVRLPEGFAVSGTPVADDEVTDVLLTGATGFLGAFLVRDLLRTTNLRVHCLVRAGDAERAWARLLDTARRYGIEEALDPARVVAVPGDLTRERLGLSEEDHDALAEAVGVVYHAAAHINFMLPYSSVKATNVDGTSRVVAFAAHRRVKRLHHMSTIAVFSPAEPEGVLTEESTPLAPEALGIGYTQSKWVAERIVSQAGNAGLPVTIYRIGRVSGDSATGACQPDDFLWRQVKSFIQLGAAPPGDTLTTDLLPVDYVARAVVALSRDPGAHDRTLHLFHPRGSDFDTVYQGIRACGHDVRVVAEDHWWELLERSAAAPGGNALAATVPLFREGALELGDNTYRNDLTATLLERLGLPFPDIEPGAVARMIRYFEGVGELAEAEVPEPVA